MANPLFQEQMNNGMQNQFNTFMQNPMQFLMQRKINIPNQYANDPHGAVQYLLNNNQMSQESLNRIMTLAQKMGFKL
jgi:hypothetical protein